MNLSGTSICTPPLDSFPMRAPIVSRKAGRPTINLSADWQMVEARGARSIRKSVRVRQLDAR